MHIIPAIDIIGGKCVRLTQGDYSQVKEYRSDPLEVAKEFEQAGFKKLHLVDLDGAKSKQVVNLAVLEAICANTGLEVDFGGGVKSRQDLEKVLNAGAAQVTCGSIAAKDPETVVAWLEEFGSEKLIIGADFKDETIAVNGWQEGSDWALDDFLGFYTQRGMRYSIATDVAKDGMLQGPALGRYRQIMQTFPQLKLIASGGVRNLQDIAALQEAGLFGVIVGKAFYEGTLKVEKLKLS